MTEESKLYPGARRATDEDSSLIDATKPTTGELDLEARSSLRRLTRGTSAYTDEQADGYDVEYRKLRLEKVILVGVWTEGTVQQIEARLEELAALAETAGSEIADITYQKRDKPDAGTYIGRGKVDELRHIVVETGRYRHRRW